MKSAVLFSGGKDSNMALIKAREYGLDVKVLITLVPENPESYMFHTPAIHLAKIQAEKIGLPILEWPTEGKREEEIEDLRSAILRAKEKYGIEAVVSGAVKSIYQATRIQKVCHSLGLWSFNPLWMRDEKELAMEEAGLMDIIISGVAAYPLTEEWLGRRFDHSAIRELEKLGISPSGEGGEFETLVINSPLFKEPIIISSIRKRWENWNGRIEVETC